MKEILSGHFSPETAYVVEDYPYGFRLRCKIRYWLEHHPKRGTRFVSQTTNPKKSSLQDIWNKPKASTYADVAGALYKDENGHVKWDGLGYYPDADPFAAWLTEYGFALPEAVLTRANGILAQKRIYEAEKARGIDYRLAGRIATITGFKRKDGTVITQDEARETVLKAAAEVDAEVARTAALQQGAA